MWIEGYKSLINTESVRAVYLVEPGERSIFEPFETTEKWELHAAFHGLPATANEIISVHETEEEARAAQGRLLNRLEGGGMPGELLEEVMEGWGLKGKE